MWQIHLPANRRREGIFGPTGLRASLQCSAALLAALTFGALVEDARAQEPTEIPFGDSRIIIETNASDCDAGIQLIFDGEPWSRVRIKDPNGRFLLDERPRGSLAEFGLTEQFNESSEPPMEELVALDPDCDEAEFSLAEFQELFPAGIYEFEGLTVEGLELDGEATFSHAMPAGPEVVEPADEAEVDPDLPLFVDWDPVTDPIATLPAVPGVGPVDIVGYRVIVQEDVHLPPEFLVELPADITEVTVSPEYLAPGKEYKLEVFAIDVSGNQTLTENSFTTTN
jgi:hypothetical protein